MVCVPPNFRPGSWVEVRTEFVADRLGDVSPDRTLRGGVGNEKIVCENTDVCTLILGIRGEVIRTEGTMENTKGDANKDAQHDLHANANPHTIVCFDGLVVCVAPDMVWNLTHVAVPRFVRGTWVVVTRTLATTRFSGNAEVLDKRITVEQLECMVHSGARGEVTGVDVSAQTTIRFPGLQVELDPCELGGLMRDEASRFAPGTWIRVVKEFVAQHSCSKGGALRVDRTRITLHEADNDCVLTPGLLGQVTSVDGRKETATVRFGGLEVCLEADELHNLALNTALVRGFEIGTWVVVATPFQLDERISMDETCNNVSFKPGLRGQITDVDTRGMVTIAFDGKFDAYIGAEYLSHFTPNGAPQLRERQHIVVAKQFVAPWFRFHSEQGIAIDGGITVANGDACVVRPGVRGYVKHIDPSNGDLHAVFSSFEVILRQDQVSCVIEESERRCGATAGNASVGTTMGPATAEMHHRSSDQTRIGRPNRKIFVGGVTTSTTKDDLQEYFSRFGLTEECLIGLDRDHRHRGFGFVTFSSSEAKDAVVAMREKHFINRKWVEVKDCLPEDHVDIIALKKLKNDPSKQKKMTRKWIENRDGMLKML